MSWGLKTALKWALFIAFAVVGSLQVIRGEITFDLSRRTLVACLVFFGAFLVAVFVTTIRWRRICDRVLSAPPIGLWTLFRVNLLSILASIGMPALGAEGLRVMKLYGAGKRAPDAALTVAVDRLVGTLGLVIAVLVLFPRLLLLIDWSVPAWLDGKVVLVLAGLLIVALLALTVRRIRSAWSALQARLREMFELHWSSPEAVILVALSVGAHLILGLGFYLLLVPIHPLPFGEAAGLYLGSQVVRAVPLSLFGFSLGEVALVSLAGLVGLPYETAVPVMLLTMLGRYLVAATGVVIELVLDGKVALRRPAIGELGDAEKAGR